VCSCCTFSAALVRTGRLAWQEDGEEVETDYAAGALIPAQDEDVRGLGGGAGSPGGPAAAWRCVVARGEDAAAAMLWEEGVGSGEDVAAGAHKRWASRLGGFRAMGLGPQQRRCSAFAGGSDGSLWPGAAAKWKKILSEQEAMAEPFGGLVLWHAALVFGVGVVHVGDVVTFFDESRGAAGAVGASDDVDRHSHVGQVECIYSVPCSAPREDGAEDGAERGGGEVGAPSWKVGHRVEAWWSRRRAVSPSQGMPGAGGQGQQRFEETVCAYKPGRLEAVHSDGTFTVQYDDGDSRLEVPARELRDRRGHVGLVVKRLFRPWDSELHEFSEKKMLLGCKGEVFDSNVWQRVEAGSLDCLRASLTSLAASQVAARDTWYSKAFDSWMHQADFCASVRTQVVGARLKFVCANYYDGARRSVAPVVVKGSAKSLLSSYKAAADAAALADHSLQDDTQGASEAGSRGAAMDGAAQDGGGPSASGSSPSLLSSGQAGGKAKVGVKAQAGGKAAQNLSEAGEELPKYMLKLTFLKELGRSMWPKVPSVLVGPRVVGLEKNLREKLLHQLTDEYLRVFHAVGEEGRKVAIRKAVEKEKELYVMCAKRGDQADVSSKSTLSAGVSRVLLRALPCAFARLSCESWVHTQTSARAHTVCVCACLCVVWLQDYRGKFSKMMKTAKETRARTEATEFSDYEEELEVDDVVCTYSV
jgi:hypothetical protein